MQDFIQALINQIGEKNVLTDPAECLVYGYDNSRRQGHPQAVVFAETTEQIQKIITVCNEYKIPLTARGRGTGTPGGRYR
jgi:D-lactate dehydrogenase